MTSKTSMMIYPLHHGPTTVVSVERLDLEYHQQKVDQLLEDAVNQSGWTSLSLPEPCRCDPKVWYILKLFEIVIETKVVKGVIKVFKSGIRELSDPSGLRYARSGEM